MAIMAPAKADPQFESAGKELRGLMEKVKVDESKKPLKHDGTAALR